MGRVHARGAEPAGESNCNAAPGRARRFQRSECSTHTADADRTDRHSIAGANSNSATPAAQECEEALKQGCAEAECGESDRATEVRSSCAPALGCIDIYEQAAPGANFFEFQERGVRCSWSTEATSDDEIGKIGPGPSGCSANRAIRRCRPRWWARHNRRPPPRLARFPLATLPTRICRYTLGILHDCFDQHAEKRQHHCAPEGRNQSHDMKAGDDG